MKKICLDTLACYQKSLASAIKEDLVHVFGADLANITLDRVSDQNAILLKHPWINEAIMDFDAKLLHVFDPISINVDASIQAILSGEIVMEHTAAGEASRLGIGTKYCLTPLGIISAIKNNPVLAAFHSDNDAIKLNTLTEDQKKQTIEIANKLHPYSIGTRKMAKVSLAIAELAKEYGHNPYKILAKQTQIIILNESTAPDILNEFKQYGFFGFNPENIIFMIQKSMEGYKLQDESVQIDFLSEKMLHNHGAMRMQQVMDNQLFRLLPTGERAYLSFESMMKLFQSKKLMISNNIEDLDQLEVNAMDIASIALGLEYGKEGYEMIMTSVGQKTPPQKGGFFAFIPGHGLACFESDQHPGLFANSPLALEKIKFLNKNVNMFPNPSQMFATLKQEDLPIHATVKGGKHKAIYPQTPQGDLNFILKTQVIIEKVVSKIRNLKSQADLLDTVLSMKSQEKDDNFMNWIQTFVH